MLHIVSFESVLSSTCSFPYSYIILLYYFILYYIILYYIILYYIILFNVSIMETSSAGIPQNQREAPLAAGLSWCSDIAVRHVTEGSWV